MFVYLRVTKAVCRGNYLYTLFEGQGEASFLVARNHTIQRQAKNRSTWPNEGALTISQPRLRGLDYSDLQSEMRICQSPVLGEINCMIREVPLIHDSH